MVTTISLVTSAIIFSIAIVLVPQTQTQTVIAQTPTNNTTNFSEAITQQVTSDTFLVGVVYESPKTVILQGSDGKSSVGGEPGQLAFNDILWKAVDLVKNKGYVVDNIDLLLTGENANIYRIYMSHPEV
jgi:ABC-type transport system involved in multi-copper enzyme maturation permease subunit